MDVPEIQCAFISTAHSSYDTSIQIGIFLSRFTYPRVYWDLTVQYVRDRGQDVS